MREVIAASATLMAAAAANPNVTEAQLAALVAAICSITGTPAPANRGGRNPA